MSEAENISSGRRSGLLAVAAAVISPALARGADIGGKVAAVPTGTESSPGLDRLFRIQASASDPDDGRRGFDFLHGRWTVAHRNRKALDEHAEWREFTGIMECRPVVGGLFNVDDNVLNTPAGPYRASTYRVFNPALKQWSIFWVSERAPLVETPGVQGNFKDGVGLFYSDDAFEGQTFVTRFKWHRITAQSARWEQASSTDGRATWVDNWFMDFTRAA